MRKWGVPSVEVVAEHARGLTSRRPMNSVCRHPPRVTRLRLRMRLKLTIVRTVVHCHVGWVQVPELTSLLASLTSADYGQERLGKNMFGWLCRKFCKGNKLLHNCAPYQATATADEGHEPDYHTDDAGFHFSVQIRGRGRIA